MEHSSQGDRRADGLDLSVVVPVCDERGNLEQLDRELREVLESLPLAAEIIYVDDGSVDGSSELLDRIVSEARGSIPTRAVHFARNYGQTAAMGAGFDLARGAAVVPMDGDLQNDPRDVPRLLAKLDEGYDVVSGWRRRRQDRSLTRRLPSRVANWLIGAVTGTRLHDYGCSQKAYRATYLERLRLYGEMHRFLPAYLAPLGARITEVEVTHRARTADESKYGLRRTFKVFLDLFLVIFMTRYHARPMHFFGQAGLLFLVLSGIAAFFMVVFKFGWLALIGIEYRATFIETPLPGLVGTFFLGGIVSIFLGILGELLVRVHYESTELRPYEVSGIVDSESEEGH